MLRSPAIAMLMAGLAGLALRSPALAQTSPAEALPPALFASAHIGKPGSSRPKPPTAPRLPLLSDAQATPAQKAAMSKYAALLSNDTALRVMGWSPAAMNQVLPVFDYVQHASTLPARDREVLILRTAWLTQCEYLWARHVAVAAQAGLSQSEVRDVARGELKALGERDRLMISLADQVYVNSAVNNETYAKLFAAYGLEKSMEAIVAGANMAEAASIFNSLGLGPDAAMRDRLPKDVPYVVRVPPREPELTAARIEPAPDKNAQGAELAISLTLKRNPALAAQWYYTPGGNDFASNVTRYDRELAILRMGWNNQSTYEWAQHVGRVGQARTHGLDPRAIAIGAAAPVWSEKDRNLIAAVDEMYLDAHISDKTWAKLAATYQPHDLVALVGVAARYRRVSQTLNALGVQKLPAEEGLPVFTRQTP